MAERRTRRTRKPVKPAVSDVGVLHAVRLRAIKSDIADNLRQQGLSIHGVASRHGVSAAYVRRLFAAEGTTFSHYVLQQRLAAAHLMLGDASMADRSISAIAFEVGFGNVASFSRAFRRRYGMKPAALRETARRKD